MSGEWIDILPASDLVPGEVRELSWQDMDLLIFRTASGELRAMNAYCPHQGNYIPNGLPSGSDLSGLLRGEELICPFHDWRFDGMGLCTGVPSGQRIPTRIAKGLRIVESWHVRERDGTIQIGAVRAVEPTQSSD